MLEDYFFTKNTKWVIWGLVAFIGALLIFDAGVVVGREGNRPHEMAGIMPPVFMHSGYGVVGTVASSTGDILMVRTRDGVEQQVSIGAGTVIKNLRNVPDATSSSLSPGTFVIVVGDPDNAGEQNEVDAHLIRILPPKGAPLGPQLQPN